MIHIKLPIHWKVGRKTEFIGLNWYRNAHFTKLNKTKKDYSLYIRQFVKGKNLKIPISITYIFHPSRKGQDLMNAISVADKFLQDALVDNGVIPDDNYENVSLVTSIVGDKDKEGYIEAIIESITI